MVPVLREGAAGFLRHVRFVSVWDPAGRDWIGVAMGAFEAPTGTRLAVHIFVDDQGDYYDIADGVRRFGQAPG